MNTYKRPGAKPSEGVRESFHKDVVNEELPAFLKA